MQRRAFLALAGTAAATGLAGCSGTFGSGTPTGTTPTAKSDSSLPNGIYVQRFRETMAMQGMQAAGDLRVAFMYSAPHQFWTVTGSELTLQERSGAIHAMAVPFHEPTGQVVPETGLSLEIRQGGESVSQEVIYPMLSQRMGFHYGGNFGLSGDGEYTARVSIGGVPDGVSLTGGYEGQFREAVTADVPFEFNEEEREKVKAEELDSYGKPGAVKPMQMEMMPQATAPLPDELPGEVIGEAMSDDATFVVTQVTGDAAARLGGGPYLLASARTRYNGLTLPAMAVDAAAGDAFEGALTRTLDPEAGYHYGATLDAELESGDEVTLTSVTPPQVSRHEGYERAFLQMDPVTLTV